MSRLLIVLALAVLTCPSCRQGSPWRSGSPETPVTASAATNPSVSVQEGETDAGPGEGPSQESQKTGASASPASGAESSAPAALSEAEKLARLERALEDDRKQLESLKRELDDPGSEYAVAEREFKELDAELEALGSASSSETAGDKEASSPPPADRLETVRKKWQLARERFNLAIEERKALREKIATLAARIDQEETALARLRGEETDTAGGARPMPAVAREGEPAREEAPAQAGGEKSEAKASESSGEKKEPAPGLAVPGLPVSPAPGSAEPTADGETGDVGDTEPVNEKAVKAREEAAQKQEIAKEAEREAESIGERLDNLQRQIEVEQKLLGTAQQRVDLAAETVRTLRGELEEKKAQKEDASGDEVDSLQKQIEEAERLSRTGREKVREHSARLNDLYARRSELQAQQIAALEDKEKARLEAEKATAEAEAWNNPWSLRNLWRWLLVRGPRILFILLAMAAASWLVRLLSGRLVHLIAASTSRGSAEERTNRAQTLVSVFQNAAWVLIMAGGVVMILQEIGIPVGPLLGGAAVLGLAVAFGSQKLIRDYFHGFVILLENQYGINDVVRVASIAGLVERITLRMTVLRDLEGVVHFIPNGEITTVSNMTHGWSRAVFDVGVAYKEDVDRVIDVLMELAMGLRKDPTFGPDILEDPVMLGVDAMADSAIMIKFMIKTRPLKQWGVKRELLRRIKKRFDELGIEIPFPHRTIYHHHSGGETEREEQELLAGGSS